MDKPRILIIEDERITSDHLRRLLTRLGYAVVGIAATGSAALKQLQHAQPDLLLADIGLPGEIDGVEVASRARHDYGIPTVFLTAFSDPETIHRARSPQPYGFLVKPFADEELHATIEIALQQNALRSQHAQQALATIKILARTQEELQAVTARMLRIQEEERAEIARDLHDDLGQRLAFLQISIETLWQKLPAEFRKDHDLALFDVLAELGQISKALRDISHRLHPSVLDDLGIVAALRTLGESFEERYSKPTRFVARSLPEHFDREVSLALYRICQEALHNIAKHGGDDVTVTIALVGSAGQLELTIRDTGAGIDPERLKPLNGLGLLSMAQRAQLVGGSLAIDSVPGQGTCIHVRIPVDETDAKNMLGSPSSPPSSERL
jgi:signal transduction histidine kinase